MLVRDMMAGKPDKRGQLLSMKYNQRYASKLQNILLKVPWENDPAFSSV